MRSTMILWRRRWFKFPRKSSEKDIEPYQSPSRIYYRSLEHSSRINFLREITSLFWKYADHHSSHHLCRYCYFRRRAFRSCRAIAASPYGILCLPLITLLRTSNSGIRLARYRSAAIVSFSSSRSALSGWGYYSHAYTRRGSRRVRQDYIKYFNFSQRPRSLDCTSD